MGNQAVTRKWGKLGLLDRLRGKEATPDTRRGIALMTVAEHADAQPGERIELHVVGESHRQDDLERIAGPKTKEGKNVFVGVALRCEPGNPHDANALRVEVSGQLVGYIARDQAAVLAPSVRDVAGGCVEADGVIVGGWKNSATEGHFGIRAWIDRIALSRMGVALELLVPAPAAPRPERPRIPPPVPGECRLSLTDEEIAAGHVPSQVTVLHEEHYQDIIIAHVPADWGARSWETLVELRVVDRNPHSEGSTSCIQVALPTGPVGYFTPRMTERYAALISGSSLHGPATATAWVHRGNKAGETFWRLKVNIANR